MGPASVKCSPSYRASERVADIDNGAADDNNKFKQGGWDREKKTKLLKAFRGASLILETVLVSKRSELTNRSNFTCLWADLASQDGHLVLE